MNNVILNQTEEIICVCSGTTKTKIQALIAKGVDNIEQIAQETGANTGCGSCDILIRELLVNVKEGLNQLNAGLV